MNRSRWTAITAALLAAALAGCAPRTPSSTPASAGDPAIADAWARPSPDGVDVGAAYLTLRSDAGDRLLAATAPPGFADRVELHAVVTDSLGRMGMQAVEAIELPPGTEVELRPGGHHVMFLGMHQRLVDGDTLELVLRFERAGQRRVRVPVGER